MHLILSTSLNPNSRSRIMAHSAAKSFQMADQEAELIDLARLPLPFCDGDQCYADPNVHKVAQAISSANSIVIAAPIYNYDVSAACKNVLELTGKAWTDKVVGFLLAAGGKGSYMSVMGIANSLMLDFRALILPRFVYATGESFSGNEISEPDLVERIHDLVKTSIRVGQAVATDGDF